MFLSLNSGVLEYFEHFSWTRVKYSSFFDVCEGFEVEFNFNNVLLFDFRATR